MDSSRYPMCSYGDPFFRLFGKKSRHFINVAQSLQQFLTVAVLILSKSMNIAQLSRDHFCFSGAMVLVMGIGMLSGIIRSLKKIGWLSNASVFMNIANFLIIMCAAAMYAPYYPAITKSTLIKTIEPIVTFAGQPPNQYQQQVPGFASQFNAVNTMVCKYNRTIPRLHRILTHCRCLLGCSSLRCLLGRDAPSHGLLEGPVLRSSLHLRRLPAIWCLRLRLLGPVLGEQYRQRHQRSRFTNSR